MEQKFYFEQGDWPIVTTLKKLGNYLYTLNFMQQILIACAITMFLIMFFFIPMIVVCRRTFSRGKVVYAKQGAKKAYTGAKKAE